MFNKGVYTAIITPFDDKNNVDYDTLCNLIKRQIENCISGIILLGTTGESPTLDIDEKKQIVRTVMTKFNTQIPIIVGVGGNNTQETLNFAKWCVQSENVPALMVTVPNYNKPTQEGIQSHFHKISQDPSIQHTPIMLYNIPSRTCVNANFNTLQQIRRTCPNIIAIKEASGDLDQVATLIRNTDYKVFSGDDALSIPIMSLGGYGVISVLSNIIPYKVAKLTSYMKEGELNKARNIYYNTYNLNKNLFIESNPIPVKYLLYHMKEIKNPDVRLPLLKMTNQDNINLLLNSYKDIFLDYIK